MALFFGLVVAVVMGLYPPWEEKEGSGYHARGYRYITHELRSLGHYRINQSRTKEQIADDRKAFIHWYEAVTTGRLLSRIDTTLLCVQWLTAAFATAAAVTLLGDWSKRTRNG